MPQKSIKPEILKEGKYFFSGNEAVSYGAVIAGCRFFAGYPITPASEIMTGIIKNFKKVDGKFIQMEDEIGSVAALIGASWGGVKSMTATSGPGFSLMMENIGLAIMTETPCVVVDVQRSGPSTGQATKISQGDVIQARWGTHGEHNIIVLTAYSPEDSLEQTIRAFNLSEKYRVPVILLLDEAIAHTRETTQIKSEYTVFDRENKNESPPFGGKLVPDMPKFGDGKKLMITGSTHDEWGRRKTSDYSVQQKLVKRLNDKIELNREDIEDYETYFLEDAKKVVISYGISARSSLAAVKKLRDMGEKVGLILLKTLWPFPEKFIKNISKKIEKIYVAELNMGQMALEVERIAKKEVKRINKVNSLPLYPDEIIEIIRSGK